MITRNFRREQKRKRVMAYFINATIELMEEIGIENLILSILVDTFISKISLTMQPGPKIDSISGA